MIFRFIKQLWIGLWSYWKAFLFIREHKLYWYFLIPALFMLGIYKMGEFLQNHQFEPNANSINGISWYLIKLLFEISIGLVLMKFSKYLVVALLSPLLAHLSQKTERIITKNVYQFDMHQLWRDIKRGLKLVMRNFIWWYLLSIIIYLSTYFATGKFITFPTIVIVFLISSFYYGFSFIDYVNERRRLNVDESILFIRKNRGLAISIGAVYSILIFVPVNLQALFDWSRLSEAPIDMLSQFFVHFFLWFCASAAPIFASIAATLAMHDVIDLESNQLIEED